MPQMDISGLEGGRALTQKAAHHTVRVNIPNASTACAMPK